MSQVISVSEINGYIKETLEKNIDLINLSVKGEISNLVYHTSGHIYFTIKDQSSQIKAIMFSSYAKTLKMKLIEGTQIIARGSIKVYQPQGQYSIQVTAISFEGLGELYIKYEQLKEALQQQGWFDNSLKKPLPRFPKNIGIVTASTGAAVRDIISTVKRRYPLTNIYLFPCLVQGTEAKFDIANKIQLANNFMVKLDSLIVGRGGGGIEDLWAFNEIEVVRAIHQSIIPVISAIGHEIDFTLSDFVSDVRAPTPTAAAELVTPDRAELQLFLKQEYRNLIKIIKQYVMSYQDKYQQLKNFYLWNKPKLIYQQQEQIMNNTINKIIALQQTFFYFNNDKIMLLKKQLVKKLELHLQRKLNYEKELIVKLDLLSPLKTLARGYSIALINDKIITSVKNVTLESLITTKLTDGKITSKITNIKEQK